MKDLILETAKAFGFTLVRYFFIAGISFFLFYRLLSLKFVANKIQSRKAKAEDFILEVKNSLVSAFIFSLIGVAVMFSPITKATLIYHDLDAYPLWWLPISVILSLIIHDTYFYWMHRLLHHKKIFRIAHVVHHRSTNPSPWASYSFHILESLTEGGVLIVLAFVLPMHPLAIFLFILLGFIINVYGLLGYEIMPRSFRYSFFFEVFNSSVHHNLHHSKFKGNYGLYFRTWDRICGTEHPDYVKEYDKVQQRRFGQVSGDGAEEVLLS
ncbi:sterol desaturase family protein [Desertivirga arenae]|uniref:sterol desaturase family protein n=1 Tax=Desertivirga arenae TaxID=2810309 RepID=UPI001A960353|nr:sterol desaturase family protein [Pedobacter sp. SYSU D00823]